MSELFNDSMYINSKAEKRRFIRNAVPINYSAQRNKQLNGNILYSMKCKIVNQLYI